MGEERLIREVLAVATAVVIAGAIAVAGGLLLPPSSGGSGPGPAMARALAEADSAKGEDPALARAHVVTAIEGALGDEFAGTWFEPGGNRLRVGVTSAEGREAVTAIAAEAGLRETVVGTVVRTGWAELEAAQGRWNRRLADLLERGDLTTGLLPGRNAVLLEVSSSVSAARREKLERAAAAEKIAVLVQRSGRPHLVARPHGRCAKFAKAVAQCDLPIASGMAIESEPPEKEKCTAGPAVILQDRKQESTKTYVLTAGHCLVGSGTTWYAFNKAGEKKELGNGVEWKWEEAGDIGLIEVADISYWRAAGLVPVPAGYVEWSTKAETDPVPVTGEAKPAENEKVCKSGRSTGTLCGEVTALNQTVKFEDFAKKVHLVEHLARVDGAIDDIGDSGAPVYKKEVPGIMLGVNIGGPEGLPTSYFMPLEDSFAALTTKLKLLTDVNEERRKCPMAGEECFVESEEYPVTYEGRSEAASESLGFEGASLTCGQVVLHGKSLQGENPKLHPSFAKCNLAKTYGAAVSTETSPTETCDFVLDSKEQLSSDAFKASLDIVCSGSAKIVIRACGCRIEIGSQSNLGAVLATNETEASPAATFSLDPEVSGLVYTVTEDAGACPLTGGTGTKSNGTYTSTGAMPIWGQRPSEPEAKLDVEVGG